MSNFDYNTPKYTEIFGQWLLLHTTWFNSITFIDNEHSTKLKDMILSMWRYYEINDKDIFQMSFMDTFNEFKDYYEELITNYEKEYDYALGNKKHVDNDGTSYSYNKDTFIELPNKVIDPNDYDKYPSTVDKNNTDNGYANHSVTTYDDEFIQLKNAYLKQIRSVYREFAYRFRDCFIMIY